MHDASDEPTLTSEQQRIAQLEAELAAAKKELSGACDTIAQLRRAYTHALEQLQLLRRRLFVAMAERADVSAEQLAFDSMFLEVQRLERALDAAEQKSGEEGSTRTRRARSEGAAARADATCPSPTSPSFASSPPVLSSTRRRRASASRRHRDSAMSAAECAES